MKRLVYSSKSKRYSFNRNKKVQASEYTPVELTGAEDEEEIEEIALSLYAQFMRKVNALLKQAIPDVEDINHDLSTQAGMGSAFIFLTTDGQQKAFEFDWYTLSGELLDYGPDAVANKICKDVVARLASGDYQDW